MTKWPEGAPKDDDDLWRQLLDLANRCEAAEAKLAAYEARIQIFTMQRSTSDPEFSQLPADEIELIVRQYFKNGMGHMLVGQGAVQFLTDGGMEMDGPYLGAEIMVLMPKEHADVRMDDVQQVRDGVQG